MSWEPVIYYLLTLVVGGVGSFLGFIALLPTKIGQKALNHHFDAKIADVKYENDVKLGKIEADLHHLKDRGIRSNEREYQAITKAWESFVEAFYATTNCVVKFRASPDLNKLDDEKLTEFLETEQITGRLAQQIIGAEDRNMAFSAAQHHSLIYTAGEKIHAAHDLLQKQSVFIPAQIEDRFRVSLLELNEVRVEQFMVLNGHPTGAPKIDHSTALVSDPGKEMFNDMRDAARERLLKTL